MGLDTMLYIRGALPEDLMERASAAVREVAGDDNPYGTHEGLCYADHEGCEIVEWHTLRRYYGPGYERGPWPVISAVIDILRAVAPDGEVFYHADSAWYFESPPFSRDEHAAYWRHWAGPDGDAYYRGTW